MNQRSRTIDRGPPAQTARIVGTIGPKRQRLTNGFLLCRDVPVARTGVMQYLPGETPIKTRDGHPIAYVKRDPQELFSPQTIGSLIAAAVTIEHPAADVTPQNVASLGKGYVLDARQGDGDDSDVLLADLIITDPHAIERIETMDKTGRTVEVSLGYEASYFQTAPGEGEQRDIICNHIALVDRGRCGPRCAIGDSDPDHPTATKERHTMSGAANPTRPRVKLNEARERVALAMQDLETAEAEENDGIHVHVHTADADPGGQRTLDADAVARIEGLESTVESIGETVAELAGALREFIESRGRTADGAPLPPQHEDSAALERSFQEFVSRAEVLVPGFKVPTFDSALPRAKTVDSMCAGRRAVLAQFAGLPEGQAILASVAGEFDLGSADCAAVAVAFNASAALKGAKNNSAHATRDARPVSALLQPPGAVGVPRPSMTISQINEMNRKFWEAQSAAAPKA